MSIHNGNFEMVSKMNTAFGNPKGDSGAIDLNKLKSQCKNILDEFKELMEAIDAQDFYKIRDALCDIHVFAYGAHHLMGLDADADMIRVISAVMTRFVKDGKDMRATMDKHKAKGITETYVEGEYPFAILKSAVDQPDAPKGKFLKSASYREPEFEGICFSTGVPVVAGNWGIAPDINVEDSFGSHDIDNDKV